MSGTFMTLMVVSVNAIFEKRFDKAVNELFYKEPRKFSLSDISIKKWDTMDAGQSLFDVLWIAEYKDKEEPMSPKSQKDLLERAVKIIKDTVKTRCAYYKQKVPLYETGIVATFKGKSIILPIPENIENIENLPCIDMTEMGEKQEQDKLCDEIIELIDQPN